MHHASHKRAVDLQAVNRQLAQIRQRRIASAKVVDGQVHAHFTQAHQGVQRFLRGVHRHAFGDFQLQAFRWQAAVLQRAVHAVHQIGQLELAMRDIHRHAPKQVPTIQPTPRLRAGGVQYPVANRHDQRRIFRNRNKLRRRHHAHLRVIPADQRLVAKQLARVQLELGLVVQQELAARQRGVQAVFQAHALHGRGVHVRGEELKVVLAALLGPIHRRVGVHQQGFGRFAILGEDGNANRGGDKHLLLFDLDDAIELGHQFLGDLGHMLDVGDILQNHGKLIAAQPRHGVAFTQRAFQPLGDFGQQLVARGMAHGVVDVLEAVQINEHQADLAAFALRTLGGQQQALHE